VRWLRWGTTALLCIAALNTVSGTYATLTAQTKNPGALLSTGTVVVSDNSAGAAVLDLIAADPGTSASGCVKVTYAGSLASTMRVYATVTGTLAPYLTLTVTRGTDSSPSFASCVGFTPDATNYVGAGNGVIYSGTLSAFPTSYTSGLVDPTSGSPATWTANTSHSYQLVVTQTSNNAAQGQSSTASFTWEARNA
jgi:hypothetical protein